MDLSATDRALGRPRVLVAEDDPSIRLTIKYILIDEGYEVVFAEDGREAVELARKNPPDVMLLDQMMPRLSGREVLRELRDDPSTSSIPVVMLTGLAGGDATEWPGARFIAKPFDPAALIHSIKSIVDGH